MAIVEIEKNMTGKNGIEVVTWFTTFVNGGMYVIMIVAHYSEGKFDHYCTYIIVPEGHPFIGMHYDTVTAYTDIDVTYDEGQWGATFGVFTDRFGDHNTYQDAAAYAVEMLDIFSRFDNARMRRFFHQRTNRAMI